MTKTDPSSFGKVAVLMGGTSAERDVSLNSGAAVLAALKSRGIDAHELDVGADVLTRLEQGQYARAFIALHGRGGEDGTIQGALEIMGLPYTGSGVMASALAMDKLRTKLLWVGEGLPTPKFRVLDESSDIDAIVSELGLPLFVKPSREGSSIGVTRVNDVAQLQSAYEAAKKFDSEIIVESCVTGKEYTAAILGQTPLPLIRLETPHEFYDYDAKYKADNTGYHIPCGLDEETEAEYQHLALKAFNAVGVSGWGRVDFICDEDGMPWLIEVNTVPGLTDHSLVPMAARAVGISFEDLIVKILEGSLSSESTTGGLH